jgi:hypothetical protein
MSILSDPETFRYSGLSHYHYHRKSGGPDFRTTTDSTFNTPFPVHTIVSPLYITYGHYRSMTTIGNKRAFFVLRDPRDLIVSWYFSTRDNHVLDSDLRNPLYTARRRLRSMDQHDGLRYGIDYWQSRGRFASLLSWSVGAMDDPDVLIVRYEDLVSDQSLEFFAKLFAFLDIDMPRASLAGLLEGYSFSRLTGRNSGQENDHSHLRRGSAGAWVSYFDDELLQYLSTVSGDAVAALGYE